MLIFLTGVNVILKGDESGEIVPILGEFVVDTTGRASKGIKKI